MTAKKSIRMQGWKKVEVEEESKRLIDSCPHRLKKRIITHLNATDNFQKNRKDVVRELEEQMTYYTELGTSLRGPKKTEKCSHGIDGLQKGLWYGLANLNNSVSENV